jgi:hypothetical protein
MAKSKFPRSLSAILFLIPLLLGACDGMIRYIDIEQADYPPLLAVSATIEMRNGRGNGVFCICITESRSIGSYRDWRYDDESIVRSGKITLSENDSVIFTETRSDFELSHTAGSDYLLQSGLTFHPGSVYRLRVDMEGYPSASATAVMPEPPLVEDAFAGARLTGKHPWLISQLGKPARISGKPMTFSTVTVRLRDNSPNRDYYMFRLETAGSERKYIATSNRTIIRDNPDIEVAQLLVNSEADVFLFDRMLVSDLSFSGSAASLELLVNVNDLRNCRILISHLSTDAYRHYRSLAFQRSGTGFFAEPVAIASNFEQAKGCFAAVNTVEAPW